MSSSRTRAIRRCLALLLSVARIRTQTPDDSKLPDDGHPPRGGGDPSSNRPPPPAAGRFRGLRRRFRAARCSRTLLRPHLCTDVAEPKLSEFVAKRLAAWFHTNANPVVRHVRVCLVAPGQPYDALRALVGAIAPPPDGAPFGRVSLDVFPALYRPHGPRAKALVASQSRCIAHAVSRIPPGGPTGDATGHERALTATWPLGPHDRCVLVLWMPFERLCRSQRLVRDVKALLAVDDYFAMIVCDVPADTTTLVSGLTSAVAYARRLGFTLGTPVWQFPSRTTFVWFRRRA